MHCKKLFLLFFLAHLISIFGWAQNNMNGFQVEKKYIQTSNVENQHSINDSISHILFLDIKVLDSVVRVFDANHQPALKFYLNIDGVLKFQDFVDEDSLFGFMLNDSLLFKTKMPMDFKSGNFIVSNNFTYQEATVISSKINHLLPHPIQPSKKEGKEKVTLLSLNEYLIQAIAEKNINLINKLLNEDFIAIIDYKNYNKQEFIDLCENNFNNINVGKFEFINGKSEVQLNKNIAEIRSLNEIALSTSHSISQFETTWIKRKNNWKLKMIKWKDVYYIHQG